ncbi:MAG: alpha/beta hydrolase [Lachnospiraceae bacterium]|nr:alpha/beta hydrolase [Lachnospiraceae bacterium]
MQKDFYIDKDGFKLYAKLDMPDESNEKMPLVILIHGLTGQMDEAQLEGVRDAANDNGMACLRVDMYGHGKSDGDFSNHNIMEWVSEILFIIDYGRSLDFVTDIYLSGHSQGGLAVMLAAAAKVDQIKSLILISPATNIVYDAKKGIFFGTKFEQNNIPESIVFWEEYIIKGNYLRVAKMINVDEAIAAYDRPVLVVHGTNDESVDVSYGIEVAKKYKNSTLKLIEGDSHCFDYHLNEMVEVLKEYFYCMSH